MCHSIVRLSQIAAAAVLPLVLLCCTAVEVQAQEDSPPDLTTADSEPVTLERVRKILRDLEGDQLQQRDGAEKELIELGPSVLPFLPEVNARTSGELKIRLQRIRASLEATDVESFFEASLLSLSGKMSVAEAIERIAKDTGNKVMLQGAEAMSGLEVSLGYDNQPFWVVLGSVMEQAKLRINAYGTTEGDLVLAAGGQYADDTPPAFNTGPFRVDVVSAQSTKAFTTQMDGQLQLSLQVSWEPRMKPVFMQIPMSTVEAKLSDAVSLQATNPQASPEIPLNFGGCSTQIDLQLERPARSFEKIDRLSGEFVVAVPSERHKYVFEKFGNGARQSEKYGDVSVTLEGARRNGAVYEMRILVEFGNSQGALDSFRGWILSNEAYLLDPKQVRLENVGLQTYAVTPNAVGIAYLFQINGDPNDFQLIYESPGMITKQTVKYELTDIALP